MPRSTLDREPAKVLNLYPIDYPFETLVERVKKGKLHLNPDFQREYKWDSHGYARCSKFIESCLMRIPLPACYFAEEDDGAHMVIDGVQRITTIQRFFDDRFALEGLTIYPELNGKKFSMLGGYKSELEATTIRCVILRKENPKGLVQEIFARLNQGSVILSPQEIRHAIYPGTFDSMLVKLANEPIVKGFKAAQKEIVRRKNSREGEELVLRFFALDDDLSTYDNNLTKFLDDFMLKNASISQDQCVALEEKFKACASKCETAFGNQVFRNLAKSNARQSATLWDLQMIGMLPYNMEQVTSNRERIRDAFAALCREPDFAKTMSGRLAYKASVLKRRSMWRETMDEIMGL